ncbi:hypothetical protein Cni_G03112 [Canna indica]|uniref:BHLH domain-containing protein n=1 Tax=Canna indica TaxID=4628 RepID=A0AAQ3Q0T8_9LILI|nr:hypothetical protein Cni_G03112 [Canna indica]
MEPEALLCEGTWSSFDPEMSVGGTESEALPHLYDAHGLADYEQDQGLNIGMLPMLWSDDSNSQSNSIFGTSSSTSYPFPLANYGGYNASDHNVVFATSVSSIPMDLSIGEGQMKTNPSCFPFGPYHHFSQPFCITDEVGDSFGKPVSHCLLSSDDNSKASKKRASTSDPEVIKKKARAFGLVPKKVKNAQRKKMMKNVSTCNEEEGNSQSSSCTSSEEDSNSSNSKEAANLNTKAKARAGRGSATDPQSIYARKRRERINERLRILQNLVPNGTKVDISTMLEEAVQYVKFLQLQIKLLSSDDMWMYAPIAYNGMNIGFDLQVSPSLTK